MPYLQIRTNFEVVDTMKDELSSTLGKAIELIPGKSEQVLMVELVDNCRLYFRGEGNVRNCYVNLAVNKNEYDNDDLKKYTLKIMETLKEKLNVEPSQVFVTYEIKDFWHVSRSVGL